MGARFVEVAGSAAGAADEEEADAAAPRPCRLTALEPRMKEQQPPPGRNATSAAGATEGRKHLTAMLLVARRPLLWCSCLLLLQTSWTTGRWRFASVPRQRAAVPLPRLVSSQVRATRFMLHPDAQRRASCSTPPSPLHFFSFYS